MDGERQEAMMREMLRFAIEPPAPGLVDRVLAAVAARPEARRESRTHWALGLVATALAAALVVTLVYGARTAREQAVPGSHGTAPESAAGVVPIRGTAVRPFFTSGAGGWLAQQSGGRTTLYRSSDGGGTWSARLTYDGGLPSQVLVDSSGAGIVVAGQPTAAAADMVLFRTRDGGASWQRLDAPLTAQAWGIPYFVDVSRGWVLASLGPGSAEIVSTRDGGATWSAGPPFNDRANFPGLSSVRLRLVWTADGRGIAVLPTGSGSAAVHVVITDDGGATWRASFPAPPKGEVVDAGNGLLDASLLPDGRGALFLQAVDLRGSRAPALFAYSTGEAGRSWSQPVRLDERAPLGRARAVFALDEVHWWASSGSGADLLVTMDGGRTVRRYAGVLPAGYAFGSLGFWSSSHGWSVAASGDRTAVFLTSDGGASWRPLAPPP
jgi:photosystem II stability/assembly factor-like uncharacterized protein